ncbi:MAG: hypothetical protein WA484_16065 [Solirubrobacteraceae bacterium]
MRTQADFTLDHRAERTLEALLRESGAADPATALRIYLASSPDKRRKHLRVLFRGLLLETTERAMDADRARLYVAWAEAGDGWPDPSPDGLRPLTLREREYALKVWRRAVVRLRSLGFHPPDLEAQPPGDQRYRKKLRASAERAVQQQQTGEGRAAAYRALAKFHATDPNAPSLERLERWQRVADRYELAARGPITIDLPHLRPDALRDALRQHPMPIEIADALSQLEQEVPAVTQRLLDDPANASIDDLHWLVCCTRSACVAAGIGSPPDDPGLTDLHTGPVASQSVGWQWAT